MTKLSKHIIHINATPEFLNNPESVRMINKMVALARKKNFKNKASGGNGAHGKK